MRTKETVPSPEKAVGRGVGETGGADFDCVSIAMLYLDGVYAEVQEWLLKSGRAARALLRRSRGESVSVPRVPTLTIEQSQMPEWARGVENCPGVKRVACGHTYIRWEER